MPDDTSSILPTPFGDGSLRSVLNWQMAVGTSLLTVQRQQLEMAAAWQRSMSAIQRDLMDQWICRFGGGVPLDG